MTAAVSSPRVLGPEQRRAALRAGSLGCLIVSGGIIVDGIIVLVIISVLGFFDALSGMSTGHDASDASHANTAIAIATVLSIGGLIGIGLIVIGMTVSHNILNGSCVRRSLAVLWTGFAISLIPTLFFALVFLGGYLITSAGATPDQGGSGAIISVFFVAVFGLIDAIITPLVAGYAFLWMAHTFR